MGRSKAKAAFDGFQEPADGVTVARDLDLHAPVAFKIDDGEGEAGFGEQVLRHV